MTGDTGWASSDTLARARERHAGVGPTPRASADRMIHAFSGRTWRSEDHEYRLVASSGGYYTAHRRPHCDNEPWTHSGRRTADVYASVLVTDLHRALGEAWAAALSSGVEVRFSGELALDSAETRADMTQARLRRFEERLADADRQAAALLKIATAQVANGGEQTLWDERIREADRKVEREREALEQARASIRPTDSMPESFDTPASVVLEAIHAIGHAAGPLTADCRRAVDQVIADFCLQIRDQHTAIVKTSIRIPTSDGQMLIGPVETDVMLRSGVRSIAVAEVRAFRVLTRDVDAPSRAAGSRILAGDMAAVELVASERGISLESSAIASVIRCPRPSVGRALACHLFGGDTRSDLTAEYIDMVVATYCSPGFVPPTRWARGISRAQQVADAIADCGGSAKMAVLRDLLAFSLSDIYYYLRRAPFIAVSLPEDNVNSYQLPACKGCGAPASVLTDAPEVSSGLICHWCRRDALDPMAVLLPADYLPLPCSSRCPQSPRRSGP